jgi:hypothetical protein
MGSGVTGVNSGWPIDYSVEGDAARAKIIAENEEISPSEQGDNDRKPQKS